MTDPTRQRAIEEYTREFFNRTNEGKVFTKDISGLDVGTSIIRKELTEAEKKERKDWTKALSELLDIYTDENISNNYTDLTLIRILKSLTVKELLLLPVAPPELAINLKISSRSAPTDKRKRLFPAEIGYWRDFAIKVRYFTDPVVRDFTDPEFGDFTDPEVGEVKRKIVDVLHYSLNAKKKISHEIFEATHLIDYVLRTLEDAGLLKHGTWSDAMSKLSPDIMKVRDNFKLLGQADLFLLAGKSRTVPIEFKATHNLLVPNDADDVIRRYNAAAAAVLAEVEGALRSKDWVNIGHPVAQTMYYMFLGGSRYGVLSSGTRSYFFTVVVDSSGKLRVLISDAWFIGQKDTLRAWACLFNLATVDGNFDPPANWHTTAILEEADDEEGADDNPNRDQPGRREDSDGQGGSDDSRAEPPSKSRKTGDHSSGAGGSATMQCMTWLDAGVAPSIPRVDGEEIGMQKVLGFGNNILCLARWNDTEVAVKVFDACKHLGRFKKEIRAYEHLKDSWGVLVPEPYFMADWRGFVVLGMQLGRVPNSSDTEIVSERRNLFRTLRRDYGFVHLDRDPRNVIYLPDKSGKGKARLAAIDLEAHEILQ